MNSQDLSPERWNTDGPRRVHGIEEEEFALGLQMKCKVCEENRNTKGAGTSNIGGLTKKTVLFNPMSVNYWEGIPYWEIPSA